MGPIRTNFSEILMKILSFTKMHLHIPCAKGRPFCPRRDEFKCFDWWRCERLCRKQHFMYDPRQWRGLGFHGRWLVCLPFC